MRLGAVFDVLYVLGSLWGGLTEAQSYFRVLPNLSRATSAVADGPRSSASVGVVAFVDVNVVPMDTERVLHDQTVLVENGRIVALGSSNKIRVPAGASRINGRGKYLIPGLADMHAHILSSTEQRIYGEGDSARAENRLLHLWLANGVTTIRNLDFDQPSWGERTLRLRASAAAGELLSPRIYTAGPWTGKKGFNAHIDVRPAEVPALITAYKAAGYDFIKVHEEGGRALWDSLMAAAQRESIPVVGHTPKEESARLGSGSSKRRRDWALAAPMKSIEHLYDYPWEDTAGAAIRLAAEQIRRAGIWITPTWMMHQQMGQMPPAKAAYARRLLQALQATGNLLLGTDDSYRKAPVTVQDELRALVEEAGLTPYRALLTGTRNVAKYFGTLDSTGTIAAGKRADLVLLRGNPLEDIRYTAEPIGTMIGGRWVARAELAPHWAGLQQRDHYLEYFREHAPTRFVMEGVPPLTKEQQAAVREAQRAYHDHRRAVMDSLAPVTDTSRGYERVLELIGKRYGLYRAVLTVEQRVIFDRNAEAWIERYQREGYHVSIPGFSP